MIIKRHDRLERKWITEPLANQFLSDLSSKILDPVLGRKDIHYYIDKRNVLKNREEI